MNRQGLLVGLRAPGQSWTVAPSTWSGRFAFWDVMSTLADQLSTTGRRAGASATCWGLGPTSGVAFLHHLGLRGVATSRLASVAGQHHTRTGMHVRVTVEAAHMGRRRAEPQAEARHATPLRAGTKLIDPLGGASAGAACSR